MMKKLPDEVFLNGVCDLLSEGKEVTMTPFGNSMLPFIRGGHDSVVLRKPKTLKVGDIALARVWQNRFVLHRIIHIDGNKLTLMGDGNLKGEEHCLMDDVSGIVIEIVKANGRRMKPAKGRCWRGLLPVRKQLLYLARVWMSFKRKFLNNK